MVELRKRLDYLLWSKKAEAPNQSCEVQGSAESVKEQEAQMLRQHYLQTRVINLAFTDSLACPWSPEVTCKVSCERLFSFQKKKRIRIHSLPLIRFSKRSETFQKGYESFLQIRGWQMTHRPNSSYYLLFLQPSSQEWVWFLVFLVWVLAFENGFYIFKWLEKIERKIYFTTFENMWNSN